MLSFDSGGEIEKAGQVLQISHILCLHIDNLFHDLLSDVLDVPEDIALTLLSYSTVHPE